MKKKKFDLFSGIQLLLSPKQWSDLYQSKFEENKKTRKKYKNLKRV